MEDDVLKRRCKSGDSIIYQPLNTVLLDRIVRFIGSGTSGTVWESDDRKNKVRVAIKVYHAKFGGEPLSRHSVGIHQYLKSRPEPCSRYGHILSCKQYLTVV